MSCIKNLLRLGKLSAGIGITLTLIFIPVGYYQFLKTQSDNRISAAIKILERRESPNFVKAATDFEQFWHQLRISRAYGAQTSETGLLEAALQKQIENQTYRQSMRVLSYYYNTVSSCALGRVCDRQILCSSLTGTIDDYLKKNQLYFAYLWGSDQVYAKGHFLSAPEFVEMCKEHAEIYAFSQHDDTSMCQFSLNLARLTGFKASAWCKAKELPYDEGVKDFVDTARDIANSD